MCNFYNPKSLNNKLMCVSLLSENKIWIYERLCIYDEWDLNDKKIVKIR